MAGATGLEPAASCVTGRRSKQLNYGTRILTTVCSFRFPPIRFCSLTYHSAVP